MSFDPITNPSEADYVVLGGRRSPGLCDVVDLNSPRRWDERRGYALSGATLIFRGIGLARWKLRLRLYTAQDWEDWHAWRDLVQRPPVGQRARHYAIQHPILEDHGVTACAVEDIKQPTQTGHGEWTIEISMVEYRVPVFTLSEPTGEQDTPVDPADQALENLTVIAQNGGRGDVMEALAPLSGVP